MSIEQIEHELTLLKGKAIFVIVPQGGNSSMSFCGELSMVSTDDHSVGFHVTGLMFAFIFYAEDVVSLENSIEKGFEKIVRICKK